MILRPTPVSSDRFLWVEDERQYVAEASDLGWTARSGPKFGRVYDDACDEGLTLIFRDGINPHPHESSFPAIGREIVCAVEREEYRDGDLSLWELRPVLPSDRELFSVVIFND